MLKERENEKRKKENSRQNLSRMQRQHADILIPLLLPLQLRRQVPQHLVQRRLAGGISAKPVLEVAEIDRAAAVGGDEDELRRNRGGGKVEEGLGANDGADGVGVQVGGELSVCAGGERG